MVAGLYEDEAGPGVGCGGAELGPWGDSGCELDEVADDFGGEVSFGDEPFLALGGLEVGDEGGDVDYEVAVEEACGDFGCA